jgi:type II secretion system protein G
MKQKRGFTLIELLIVIVIIGILAVIVVGLVATNARNRANDAAAKADMREIQTALESYFVDTELYPATADVSTALVDGGYMSTKDFTTYVYAQTDAGACYTLTYTLANVNDQGPGVDTVNHTYVLTCKQ